MRKLFASLMCLLALGFALAPRGAAQAEDVYGYDYEPVAVLSITSVEEVVSDMQWLAESAGFKDQSGFLAVLAGLYTAGWDDSSPAGMVLGTDGEEFVPLGFVPVEDLQKVFNTLEEKTGQRPEDEGDGLYVYQTPQEDIYIREANGYAFFSNDEATLDLLPETPGDLLGDLTERYTVATQIYIQAIPEQFRDFAVQQIKVGLERGLRQQPGESDEAYELRQEVMANQIEQVEQLIHDTDELTIGLAINAEGGSTYLDFSLTVLEDSKLARQIDAQEEISTDYDGFLVPGAAVTLNFSSQMLEEDVDRTLIMLDHAENNALAELENSSDLNSDAEREAASELMQGLFDVLKDTVREGRIDGGAALVLEDSTMTMVAGGHVANGTDLEEQFDRMIDLAKNDPNFPGVEREVLEHEGVVFHQIMVPIDDREAQRVFGEELEILVGFGEESFYVVVGGECEDVVTAVIDGSGQSSTADLPPMQLNVALTPILRFASEMEDNPIVQMVADTLEDREGSDRIMLHGTMIENGVKYRLEVEPGVIEAIGTAVHGVTAGFAPQPAF